MSEETFNLIPPAYQRQRRLILDARLFGLAAVALLLIASLWWVRLDIHLGQNEDAVAEIVSQLRARQAQELDLQTLQNVAVHLEQRLQTLDALRGGFSAQQLLRVIDSALNPGIRFNSLRFERASVDDGQADVLTGGLMRVNGDAENHVALGDFLAALQADPWVRRAELQRSGSNARSGAGRVSFEVVLRLDATRARGSL